MIFSHSRQPGARVPQLPSFEARPPSQHCGGWAELRRLDVARRSVLRFATYAYSGEQAPLSLSAKAKLTRHHAAFPSIRHCVSLRYWMRVQTSPGLEGRRQHCSHVPSHTIRFFCHTGTGGGDWTSEPTVTAKGRLPHLRRFSVLLCLRRLSGL